MQMYLQFVFLSLSQFSINVCLDFLLFSDIAHCSLEDYYSVLCCAFICICVHLCIFLSLFPRSKMTRLIIYYYLFVTLLELKPKALCMQRMYSTTELHSLATETLSVCLLLWFVCCFDKASLSNSILPQTPGPSAASRVRRLQVCVIIPDTNDEEL